MTSKELYHILYNILQPSQGNKKAHSISNIIKTPLLKHIKAYNNSVSDTSKPTNPAAVTNNNTHTNTKLSREDIISNIEHEIALSTGKDKLAFITELNKLEDNYTKGDKEQAITLELVKYPSHCPWCDSML